MSEQSENVVLMGSSPDLKRTTQTNRLTGMRKRLMTAERTSSGTCCGGWERRNVRHLRHHAPQVWSDSVRHAGSRRTWARIFIMAGQKMPTVAS